MGGRDEQLGTIVHGSRVACAACQSVRYSWHVFFFLLTASIYFALRCRTVGLGLLPAAESDAFIRISTTEGSTICTRI